MLHGDVGAQESGSAIAGAYLQLLGHAAGVVVADGTRRRVPIVIADTSPHALLRLVDDAMPAEYARRLSRFSYGPRTVKVDWALDGPTR